MSRIPLMLLLMLMLPCCGKGGDFLTASGVCEGYQDPATSPYRAPWPSGIQRMIWQGNCGGLTHIGAFRFSYDIGMDIHSPILAARDGTVLNVVQTYHDGNGCPHPNEIWVQHDDGTVGTYLHLTNQGSLVGIGDTVKQGQQIAWSGLTGCTTGPHLHFALYWLDTALDPAGVLPQPPPAAE